MNKRKNIEFVLLNKDLIKRYGCIAVVIIVLLLLTSCSGETTDSAKESFNSCCVIKTATQASSGFIIGINDEYVTVVATAHGTYDWGEGSSVGFFDGSEAFGQIYGVDDELDYAFIDVPKSDTPDDTLKKIESIKRVGKEVDITNADIYAYDFFNEDNGDQDPMYMKVEGVLELPEGYIYNLDKQAMKGRLSSLSEGMSGSPVFNKEGDCIGMITAGNDEGDFAALHIQNIPDPYK